ncbi:Mannosyl-oligosaccharide 1,2-alpha-mannosidase IC [Varanus komodoensis]|nr:Mannosyl-oligosaccharide 1,2-alpha-mannosidase IC [Varanus komodoensis]
MLLLRKLPGMPGWPPSAALGLRLPQKFLFLLFLSGLLTLCFGALFLLPDSSRFKRLFLPRRGVAGDPDVPHSPPPTPGPDRRHAAPSPGNAAAPPRRLRDPKLPPAQPPPAVAAATSSKRDRHSPRQPPPPRHRQGPPGERKAAGAGAGADTATPLRQTGAPFRFDYELFRRSLRHPVLGRRRGGTEDPENRARRLKIKELEISELGSKTVLILQLVQNRAARLLTGTSCYSHITPVLYQLHWLPVDVWAKLRQRMFNKDDVYDDDDDQPPNVY